MLHFQPAGMGPFSGRPVTAQTKQQTNMEISMRLTCSMWSYAASSSSVTSRLLDFQFWSDRGVFFAHRSGKKS